MIVRSYLDWSRTASAQDRALAVRILAEMHVSGELPTGELHTAEAALLMAIEDSALIVRKALAEVLGASPITPRPIILALMQDRVEIAGIILANSPVLTDADLITAIRGGDTLRSYAVAMRPVVSLAVSSVLIREAEAPVLRALLRNEGAEIAADDLSIALDRFPSDGDLRELLSQQPGISAHMRLRLAKATAHALSAFAESCGWMESIRSQRLQMETGEKLVLTLASGLATADLDSMVGSLSDRSELTPRLLLRSVLSGDARLLVAAMAYLSGLPHSKILGFAHSAQSAGFRAAYAKALLPEELRAGFEAALTALKSVRAPMDGQTLQMPLINMTLTSISGLDPVHHADMFALLSRFQIEAAQAYASAEIEALMLETPDGLVLNEAVLEGELTMALEKELRLAA